MEKTFLFSSVLLQLSRHVFLSLPVCVISLHSQMLLNISDPLTNSPIQCSHYGYSQEMYKKEEEEVGAEDKQSAGPRFPWWVVRHRLTGEIFLIPCETSSGPWHLFREKTLGLPKASWRETLKKLLFTSAEKAETITVGLLHGLHICSVAKKSDLLSYTMLAWMLFF